MEHLGDGQKGDPVGFPTPIPRKVALSMVRVEEDARQKSLISTENLRKFVGFSVHHFLGCPREPRKGDVWKIEILKQF